MATPYSHIPGIRTRLEDGGLRTARTSTQERLLILGPATKGPTNELLSVYNTSTVASKYGASSPVIKKLHEVLDQGADNIRIMRSGGKVGVITLEDSSGGTLTITTSLRDDEALDRYALFIENDGSSNRYFVYDLEDEDYVYDSLNSIVLDTGVVEIDDDGFALCTSTNDRTDITVAESLADITTGDFSPSLATVTAVNGSDGVDVSLVEKYAALSSSYFLLDYKDGDIVIPAEVFIDDANIADEAAVNRVGDPAGATNDIGRYGAFFLGVPVAESERDVLGYLWQYVYQGKVYTYMSDTSDYFSETPAAATITVNTDLVLTALVDGKGGNAISIEINAAGPSGPTVAITETDFGLDIVVTDDGTADTTAAVGAINTALGLFTLSSGALASTVVQASGGAATLLITTVKTNLTGGVGGAVLTHEDLTGDAIPSAVSTRFAAGADAELRECNFAHQLASFCYLASTNWKMMTGVISAKSPTAFSRTALSTYVGSKPEYTEADNYSYIDSANDNGSGLLGLKLLAGKAISGEGYRSGLVADGDSTDSYAYGGIILTKGSSLPNGDVWPYGIDDGDEALDSNGNPVDIGRHIWVCGTWLIHNNGFNGGLQYRGSIEASFAAKLASLPSYKEPIGRINGRVRGLSGIPRIHSAQIDALSELRFVTIRQEDGIGPIFTSAKTAAHPDSDFAKASTIRSVNFVLNGIRNICHGYIGEPLDAQRLAALQSDLDLYLFSVKELGYHQGARATLKFTRAQKVLGAFDVVVRMVPPFAIESITVEMSLAADESEL